MTHDLETMLDGFGRACGSAGAAPPDMFIRRVRRRRIVRRVTRGGGCACAIALFAGAFFLNRPSVSPAEHTEPEVVYVAMDWPPLAAGGTGGPAEPIRAGIRPTDPLAAALLK